MVLSQENDDRPATHPRAPPAHGHGLLAGLMWPWTSYPPSSTRHDVHCPHSSSVAPCSCHPGRCAPAPGTGAARGLLDNTCARRSAVKQVGAMRGSNDAISAAYAEADEP